jgi:hypothetical protein
MAENNLVTISKVGEPKLRILSEHLPQHVKLGWKHVEDEVEAEEVKADIRTDGKKKADK